MTERIRTPNLPIAEVLDEFIGHRDDGTGMNTRRANASSVGVQLSLVAGVAYPTWAALAATTGASAGERRDVFGDAGSHVDPITSVLVSNSGIYSWSASPAGWRRVSDNDVVSLLNRIVAEAALRSNGDASLQAQISALTGTLNFKGTWNAATNTPALASSVGTLKDAYWVSAAGSTNLNGESVWGIGDVAVFNGSVWQRIPYSLLYGWAEGHIPNYATRAVALTKVIPGGMDVVLTAGRTAVGDGGGGRYYRVGATNPNQPGSAWQDAAGQWFAQDITFNLNPMQWGAGGVGADDSDAIQNLFNYIATLPVSAAGGYYKVEGHGRNFGAAKPITLTNKIHLQNASFTALTGASWVATSAGVSIPNPLNQATNITIGPTGATKALAKGVLTIESTSWGIALDNISIDVNRIPNCTGLVNKAAGNIEMRNIDIRHWWSGGNGYTVWDGGTARHWNMNIIQFTSSDAEYLTTTRHGTGLYIQEAYDNEFYGINVAVTLVPMFVSPNSERNVFERLHPYQVLSPNDGIVYGIVLFTGFANQFNNVYLDACQVHVFVRNGVTNSGRPQIQFNNVNTLYGAWAPFASSAWFVFNTDIANTPLWSVSVSGEWASPAKPFLFATTGAGSWGVSAAELTKLNNAAGNAALIYPKSGSIDFIGSINLLGGGLAGFRFETQTMTISGGIQDLKAEHNGYMWNINNAGAQTLRVDGANTSPMTCFLWCQNSASITLTGINGATINGSASIALAQKRPYMLHMITGGPNAVYSLL